MKKQILIVVFMALVFSCKEENREETVIEETPTSGNITILADKTVQPIVEDVLAVFHSVYKRAHIAQVNKDETGLIQALLNDSVTVAVLPRKLTAEEEAHFTKRKITPRISEFATDAVALITNNKFADTIVNLQDVYRVLQGEESVLKGKLVFDNANSSTLQYMLDKAGVAKVPDFNIYSLKSTEEVIKYVHDNDGAIGVVGLNWLLQAPPHLSNYVDNIKVMAVNNVKNGMPEEKYYKPSQANLAKGLYPLSRTLYVLNYQGKNGLGMGFASYIGGIEGQRIILKSGLLPIRIPAREIAVRGSLEETEETTK